MRIGTFCFLWFAFSYAAQLSCAEDSKHELTEVINKAIKAHGGKANLLNLKQYYYRSNGKVTFSISGKTYPISREFYFQAPDRHRISVVMQVNGIKLYSNSIANGDAGWFVDNINIPKNMTKQDLRNAREDAYQWGMATLVPFIENSDLSLSYLGEMNVENVQVIGVRVSSKTFKDVDLYFSKKTFLLFGTSALGAVVDQEMCRLLTIFDDYKNYEGLLIPTKKSLLAKGATTTVEEIIEFKCLKNIDKAVFENPLFLPPPPSKVWRPEISAPSMPPKE
jgi:hypothetical protein